MKVVYYYATVFGKDYPEQRRLLSISLSSVRRHLPRFEVIHLTDAVTRPLYGVDSVIRVEGRHGITPEFVNRAQCQSQIDGDVLFLDTDTIVTDDVTPVFHGAFDIAVAGRNKPEEYEGLPFNQGVVFSRNGEFWSDVSAEAKKNGIYDERAFNAILANGKYRVKELPETYNYAVAPDMKILHFKGARKKTMLCLS